MIIDRDCNSIFFYRYNKINIMRLRVGFSWGIGFVSGWGFSVRFVSWRGRVSIVRRDYCMRIVNWVFIRVRDRRVFLIRRVRVSVGEGVIVKKSLFFEINIFIMVLFEIVCVFGVKSWIFFLNRIWFIIFFIVFVFSWFFFVLFGFLVYVFAIVVVSWSFIMLVGLTLLWGLVGFIGYTKRIYIGFNVFR